jgi:preprotein translocase subunit SecD
VPRLFLRGAFASAILLTPAAAIAEPLLLEIERASAAFDQRTSEPVVTFVMKEGSKHAFSELTRQNVGRAMEFRIDGRAVMAPVIREPILGGSGQIAARFSIDEARNIAQRLQAGTSRLEVEIVK